MLAFPQDIKTPGLKSKKELPCFTRAEIKKEPEVMKTENLHSILLDLLYDVIGSTLFSIGIYTFAKSSGFATGGFSGLGLILNYITGLPIGIITFLLNIPVIILSYRMLGKRFLVKSIRTMIIQTIILDMVLPKFPAYTGNQLLASIFCGVFVGAGMVLIFMRGSSTGGSDFLVLSLRKLLPHMSIGQFNLLLDGVVLALGGVVYGNIDAMLYGLISTYACAQVIDRVMYGAGSGKLAFIVTRDGMETAGQISKVLGRGSTLVKAIGTFSGAPHDLLLCACSRNQIFRVRSLAHQVDRDALVMISEVDEVYGEGFKPPPEN